MKIKRYLILVLALSLLLTAVCMFTATAEGEVARETAPDINLKIYAKNLSLENAIYISYAVPVAGTESADSVKLLIWMTPQDSYTYGTQTYELSPEGTTTIGSAQYYVFVFDKLAAKRMAVDIYAKVYATDGENEYYSALDKYSILQYAYNKLGKTSSNEPSPEMANLLNGMLDYGAYAQEYFGFDTDRLANDNYYQIKVNGATLSDGATHGLYLPNTQVTATAPEKNANGEDFLCWQNSAGEKLSESLSYTITVGEVNETYTAVYGIKEAAPVEPLIYTQLADGTYSVKANPDAELPASVIIPSTHEGAAVTAIEDSAFLDCTGITSILLPEGIKTIGNKAFSGCTGLTELEIPETVKTIGTRAFYGCSGITEITIPASVTEIGTQIFYKASNLSTVYYNSTYADQNNPFLAVASIETVVFGGSYVPNRVAYNNTTLKNVIIQDGVRYVDDYAFYGCTGLTNVTIGDSVTSIDKCAFENCTGLTGITIPDSVTIIDYRAFCNCINLTNLTLGTGVQHIAPAAFIMCDNLSNVYITDLEAWCNISFSYSNDEPSPLLEFDYYSTPLYYGANLYLNNELVTELEIPDTITKINDYAFYNCTSLERITIPDSVTSIGERAFYNCTNLKKVYYTGTVEDWCKITFSNWASNPVYYGAELYFDGLLVTDVEIPDTITKINNYMFCGCTNLTSIIIPDSVTSIGERAFYYCTSLTSIIIPDSVTSIGINAFSYCSSLTSVTIPDSVTSICERVFYRCTSLTSITIPDSVTSIGSEAFYYCYKLVEVINHSSLNIVAGLSDYGYVAYYAKEVHREQTQIVDQNGYLFYTYNGINYLLGYVGSDTVLTLPESYNGQNYEIYKYAFYNWTGLASVILPASVTTLYSSSFAYTTQIYYLGTQNDLGYSADNLWIYSETEPTTPGYWRYVDGTPTIWVVKVSIDVESTYDNDNDGTNDVYTLTNYLDPKFSADSVIKLAGGDHLATDIGVAQAYRIPGSGIYHYYINVNGTDDSQKILSWEFTVAEAGVYEICFDLAMKDASAQRGTTMQIDDGEKIAMNYTITAEAARTVRDETQGAYMYGIPTVELTAGKHILKMTYDPLCPKTFHFRNIYLAKVS